MPPAPTVFISYSQTDKVWKDRLLTHLRISEKEGLLELWDDRRISVGTEWRSEIEKAIDAADIGILLISADFLVSDFIRGEEIPRMLERRSKNGMRLFPVMIRSCDWQIVSWLAPIQIRPTGARPLADFRGDRRDSEMAAIAREIRGILESKAAAFGVPQAAFPILLARPTSSADFKEDLDLLRSMGQGTTPLREIDRVRQASSRRSTGFWFAIGIIALLILAAIVLSGTRLWNLHQTDWGDVDSKVSTAVVRIRCLYRLRLPMIVAANTTAALSAGEVLLWEGVTGSGVLVQSGLVLTAKHVVEPWKVRFRNWEELQKMGVKAEYDELDVQFENQQPIKATLVASSDEFDLGLIQIRPTATHVVPIAASNRAVRVAERIAVISYPALFGEKPSQVKNLNGFDANPTSTVSGLGVGKFAISGIVSY